ncbi:unnamed protein product [Rangifer tarandus platyrhynchus]|uniref:Uncharacterized protein n=2 Tax=Rangifer tarandus platyrhynchus TaxID=3082113 RepID=A0ABN8Z051_RANTA|nr:unnamed protein product [Rangifer tarandus platyrhynchus]
MPGRIPHMAATTWNLPEPKQPPAQVLGLSCEAQGSNGETTSLVAQRVKRLLTMRETRVQSLGREDLLEKEMANHPSILAWELPWMEEPGGLQPMGWRRVTFTFNGETDG